MRCLFGAFYLGVLFFGHATAEAQPVGEKSVDESAWVAAVLRVAGEREASARTAGDTGLADAMAGALKRVEEQPLLSVAATDPRGLSVLRRPRVVVGNPYLERMVAGARDELSRPDVPWPVAVSGKPLFGAANSASIQTNPRDTAARMEAFLWLHANPDSPLRGEPELIARFLRRAHAYVDAILLQPENPRGTQIYDDFAMAPAACALREFRRLYPGLLLPPDAERWDRAMRLAGDLVMRHTAEHRKAHPKGYANIDAAKAFQLLNFGLYLSDEAMVAEARSLAASLEKAILPDGGTHYIWSQNESCGYHEVIPHFLARMHEITGDEEPLRIIRRLEWYGPVSVGRLAEYWTAPSWKHTWNSSMKRMGGGEFVASITGNPYARWIAGEPEFNPKDLRRWEQARVKIPWYRNDLPSKEPPDGVIYPDRNIDGVRAFNGRFVYAATLRDIPPDEPGHATLMGAHVTQADGSLGVVLMGAYPRVGVGDKPEDPRSWAWLTSGMRSGKVIGRGLSALVAEYELAAFGSSRKGAPSGWRGRQLWFTLPDRLVVWMALEPPPGGGTTRNPQHVFRLGTGGTVNGPRQTIRELKKDEWIYGDMIVRISAHDMKGITAKVVPFRLPDRPVTELVVEGASGRGGWVLAEIRPGSAPASAPLSVIDFKGGAVGFALSIGPRHFQIAGNPGASEVVVPAPRVSARSSVWVSGSGAPNKADGRPLALPPHGVAVWADSPEESDHLPGWGTYAEMIDALENSR